MQASSPTTSIMVSRFSNEFTRQRSENSRIYRGNYQVFVSMKKITLSKSCNLLVQTSNICFVFLPVLSSSGFFVCYWAQVISRPAINCTLYHTRQQKSIKIIFFQNIKFNSPSSNRRLETNTNTTFYSNRLVELTNELCNGCFATSQPIHYLGSSGTTVHKIFSAQP